MIVDRKAFILANTRLTPVPHVPEISVHVASAILAAGLSFFGIPTARAQSTLPIDSIRLPPGFSISVLARVPNAREMAACKPWLTAEFQVIKPKMVICLGATAAQDLFGSKFKITKERGKIIEDTGIAPMVMATVHPSSILRAPDHDAREKARREFTEDLAKAAKHLKSHH